MTKYLIMDVDGSLTDGKIYMGPMGEAMKAFSIKDGYAISHILKSAHIKPIVITARDSSIVRHRCDELGIKDLYQGQHNKLAVLQQAIGESLNECAYFGDDLIDLQCMSRIKESGGLVGCPADAVSEVKRASDYICVKKAGDGALREFVEWLTKSKINPLVDEKQIQEAIFYLKNLEIENIPVGKRITVNENFSYSILKYNTKPERICGLESHRKCIDIQIIISGEEILDISDISRLTLKEDYDYEKDLIIWHVSTRMVRTTLKAGDYIVLYPEHAHRGGIMTTESSEVVKIVGKIKLE